MLNSVAGLVVSYYKWSKAFVQVHEKQKHDWVSFEKTSSYFT